MPVKFKESTVVRVKGQKKSIKQNFYMKNTPLSELTDALGNSNTTPKLKQKIRNELVKRGVEF